MTGLEIFVCTSTFSSLLAYFSRYTRDTRLTDKELGALRRPFFSSENPKNLAPRERSPSIRISLYSYIIQFKPRGLARTNQKL